MNRTSRNIFAVLAGLILSAAAFTAHAHCAGAGHNAKKHPGEFPDGCDPPPPPGGMQFTVTLRDIDPDFGAPIVLPDGWVPGDPEAIVGTVDGQFNNVNNDEVQVIIGDEFDTTPVTVDEENFFGTLEVRYDDLCWEKLADVPQIGFPSRWLVGHTQEQDVVTALFQGIVGDPDIPEDVYHVQFSGDYDRDCPFPPPEPGTMACPNPIELTDWQIADRRKGNKRCRVNRAPGGISVWLSIDEQM